MATLTLHDVPEDLLARLEERAHAHGRSLNAVRSPLMSWWPPRNGIAIREIAAVSLQRNKFIIQRLTHRCGCDDPTAQPGPASAVPSAHRQACSRPLGSATTLSWVQ
ncbi:MAG: FitA-like ribbon-helix-helix domain-containing protein [Cyanobacteriota bacterium]